MCKDRGVMVTMMIFKIFHEDVRSYLYPPSWALGEEHLCGLNTCPPST